MKERSAILLTYNYVKHGKDGVKIVFEVLYKDNQETEKVEAFHPDMTGENAFFVAKTIALSLVNTVQNIRLDEKGRPYIRLYNNRGGLYYSPPNEELNDGIMLKK